MKRVETYKLLLLAVFSLGLAAKKSFRPVLKRAHKPQSNEYATISIVGPDSSQNKAIFESIVGPSGDKDIVEKQVGDGPVIAFMLTDNEADNLDQRFQRIGLSDALILVVSAIPEEFKSSFDSAAGITDALNSITAFDIVNLCVLVTGMDDPRVNFSQEIFEGMKKRIVKHLKDVRSPLITRFKMIPLPSSTYSNLIEDKEKVSWYSESSLWDFVTNLNKNRQSSSSDNALLSVLKVERVPEIGTVVTGKVLYGSFSEAKLIKVCPSKAESTIKKIWDLNDEQLLTAERGQVVKLLVKVKQQSESDAIELGSVITYFGKDECQNVLEFEAKLVFYNSLVSELELDSEFGAKSKAKASSVKVVNVKSSIDIRTDKVIYSFEDGHFSPTRISAGAAYQADLVSSVPVTIETFGYEYSLSRLVLTDSDGRVVGVAHIRDVQISLI